MKLNLLAVDPDMFVLQQTAKVIDGWLDTYLADIAYIKVKVP